MFLLKEINAHDGADEPALELFATCRERVVSVSATHLIPEYIAVSVVNGFIELIHAVSGEFRLFLTHLNHIPLDASLRCFSLVPNFYATALSCPQHYLLYSLSYSNEILLANIETGRTHVLATCNTRPSAVYCDSDYIACGEGDGCVTVWQTSGEDLPEFWPEGWKLPVLWRSAILNDTISCLSIHRDTLLCCSASYHCFMVSIEQGSILTRLSVDFEPVVAAFPLTYPRLPHLVLAVCLQSRVSVFERPSAGDEQREATAERGATSAALQAREKFSFQPPMWRYSGGTALDADVECASCIGPYLATGTSSGVVVLYRCEAALAQVDEVIRFDVGYGVKGIQLFDDSTLVVVTSAGDVWRWPLQELLQTAEGEEAGDDDVASTALQPSALPIPQPMPVTSTEALVGPPPNDFSYTQEGEVEDRCLSHHDTVTYAPAMDTCTVSSVLSDDRTQLTTSVPRDEPLAAEMLSSEGVEPVSPPTEEEVEVVELIDTDNEGHSYEEVAPDPTHLPQSYREEGVVTRSPATVPFGGTATRLQPEERFTTVVMREKGEKGKEMIIAGADSESHAGNFNASPAAYPKQEADPIRNDHSHSAPSVGTSIPTMVEGEETPFVDAAPVSATLANISHSTSVLAEEEESDSEGQIHLTGDLADRDVNLRSRDVPSTGGARTVGDCSAMDALEEEFTKAMKRVLGSSSPVEGLRAGPRMNPRKVVGILQNRRNQQLISASTLSEKPLLIGLNSTELLQKQQVALHEAEFDFDSYRDNHRLEVDALLYRHPIRGPTYSLEDRVFADVAPCIKDGTTTHRLLRDQREGEEVSQMAPVPQDELRDATFGRVGWRLDPAIVEERRRGGPALSQHQCDDLIYFSSFTEGPVLFKEEVLSPSDGCGGIPLLPMPLPPASSVF